METSRISLLGSETSGHPQVCIAVLDGLVDLKHPCFQGADLSVLPTLVTGQAKSDGQMSLHGTHVASVIFGQPSSPVIGIAPACKGLIVPVFHDDRLNLSQLDLARAIALFIRLNVCCLVILNIKTGKS